MDESKFSIIIPTWNNIAYLKACVGSIQKNSAYEHELVLHINDGSDGTLKWAGENNLKFTHSVDNVGVCLAVNSAYSLTTGDYIVYMNDDMYVCPRWDQYLLDEIKIAGERPFMLSSTMIEPLERGDKCVVVKDYGRSVESFSENDLLKEFERLERHDWQGSMWPPSVVHRRYWDQIGGFSIEFSPGLYSDPDFCMKLWKVGCRLYKGVGKSKVYHFGSKTNTKKRIKMNNGRKQFLQKWGISASTFVKYYLRCGEKFTGPVAEPVKSFSFRKELIRGKIKRLLST